MKELKCAYCKKDLYGEIITRTFNKEEYWYCNIECLDNHENTTTIFMYNDLHQVSSPSLKLALMRMEHYGKE